MCIYPNEPYINNGRAMEMRQTYARVKSETRDGSLNEIHDVVRALPACLSACLSVCLPACL